MSWLGWAVYQLEAGVRGESEAVLRSWRAATALLAAVAGWKSHDAGYEQQARHLLTLGYRIASEAGNGPVQAFLLSALVRQAVHIGRPKTGLDMARYALQLGDDASPLTLGMLHTLKARAYGRIGKAAPIPREVGLAEETFARASADDYHREPWLTHYDEAELFGDTGTAWHMLAWHHTDAAGKRGVAEAADRLAQAAHGYGDAFSRSRALCGLMAASAYMRAGDVDAAVATGHAYADDVVGLRSSRVDGYIRDLQHAAAPYRRRAEVQDVLQQLTPAEEPSS